MCYTPLLLKRDGAEYTVPCGRCPQCVQRRASAWSFRLTQEDKRSDSSLFITLTYDNAHIPITPKKYMGLSVPKLLNTKVLTVTQGSHGTVQKTVRKYGASHLQLFFKRLRKAHGSTARSIKYYAVGEYGGRTYRPHYHIILFNARVELIQKAWQLGQVHYGKVTGASIGYCLKYMCKPNRIPMHANDDRPPEFALMSKDWAATTLRTRLYAGIKEMSQNVYTVIMKETKR